MFLQISTLPKWPYKATIELIFGDFHTHIYIYTHMCERVYASVSFHMSAHFQSDHTKPLQCLPFRIFILIYIYIHTHVWENLHIGNFSQFDCRKPPPQGGVSYLLGSLIKNLEEEDPIRSTWYEFFSERWAHFQFHQSEYRADFSEFVQEHMSSPPNWPYKVTAVLTFEQVSKVYESSLALSIYMRRLSLSLYTWVVSFSLYIYESSDSLSMYMSRLSFFLYI